MDKNKAVIDYLLTCESIYESPLYFNLADIKNGINSLILLSNDRNIERPYIDGSVLKQYSLTIQCYSTISNNPIVKVAGIDNENVSDVNNIQQLIDWIVEQNDNKNFPNFGEDCLVEEIRTTSDNPRLDQIDKTQSNPLARYSFTIQIDYLDKSKMLWK